MITKIAMKNFRGHPEVLLEFGPGVNLIRGKNEAGKTTVGHAIAFAFYGVDLNGIKNPDHLITFEQDSCEVSLLTDKAQFVRSKRRGNTSGIKFSKIGVPLIASNQTTLAERLGMSFDLFASCVHVGYFMKNLDQKRKMEVISQIIRMDRKEILLGLFHGMGGPAGSSLPRCVRLEKPLQDATAVANERRVVQNQLSADQGALSQVEEQAREFQQGGLSADTALLESQIHQLEARMELFRLYQQELSRYRLLISRAKEVEESNRRKLEEKQRLELELQAMEVAPDHELKVLEDRSVSVQLKIEEMKKKLKPLPAEPVLPRSLEEPTCTRCGQVIPEKLRDSVVQERENILNQYNKQAREVADYNQEVTRTIEHLQKEFDSLLTRKADLFRAKASWESKQSSLSQRLKDLVPQEVSIPGAPAKPPGDEAEISKKLHELHGTKQAAQMWASKKEILSQKRETLLRAIDQRASQVSLLKIWEDSLKKLPEAETRSVLAQLSMPGVEVGFSEEGLQFMDDRRVPYESLSTGRQMKMDLEIAKLFQRYTGQPGFYFLDNADLMDEYEQYLPKDAQIFIAKVDPSVQSVQVVVM